MEITVRRTGGSAGGHELLGPVGTAGVDARLAEEIESVVRDVDFFDLPMAFPPNSGADLFEFAATVVDGDRSHSTSWDDLSDRPPQLDTLVELLLRSGATWRPATATTAAKLSPLFQSWTHSREEDTDDVELYRPEAFPFPPSFGRDGFQIRPDGTFLRRDVGPADGTVEIPGQWTAKVVNASFDYPTTEAKTFALLSYDHEQLRLRRQPDDRHGPGAGALVRSCLLLDFDTAEILVLESDPPQYLLAVSGTKPYRNMEVKLAPLVYVRQPEYWGIEAIGCAAGLVLPAEGPFSVTLPLAGVTGTKGVEVIGASRAERLGVPPAEAPELACGDWSAFLDLQPPGPPILRVRGSCTFGTAGHSAALSPHEPQGFNPKDLLLDLSIIEPSGPVAQVITELEVRYEEEVQRGAFDTVTILPDGISLDIQEVH